MLEVCVIAFTNMRLAFPECPARDVAERMECKVEGMSQYAELRAVCIDPATKRIVYDHKVYRVQTA